MTGRTLAVVEHGYRGAVEKQYVDGLYFALELDRQLGGIDVLLRGTAVAYAARDAVTPPIRVGRRVVRTLTAPARQLTALLDAGVPVLVRSADLPGAGLAGPGRLLDRVRTVPGDAQDPRWDDYRMVIFL